MFLQVVTFRSEAVLDLIEKSVPPPVLPQREALVWDNGNLIISVEVS